MSQLASVRDEALNMAHKKLVIIGCGDYQPIKHYCGTVLYQILWSSTLTTAQLEHHPENTGYKGLIYADPSRELYQIFNLTENLDLTPKGQEKKSYVADKSYWGNFFSSIWV